MPKNSASRSFQSLFLLILVLLSACTETKPLVGERRWRKFVTLEPNRTLPWVPTISTNKGIYTPEQSIQIHATAPVETFFYVMLMLPNNDIYLIAPSPKVKNHKGLELDLSPAKADFEFFAPNLTGTVYLGVITTEQNLNLIGEGWLAIEGLREFDTWPADRNFDTALSFISEALDGKPWALSTTSFVIARPYTVRKKNNP